MKKVNLIIIATIIPTLLITMLAFQPTHTEASSKAILRPTKSPVVITPKNKAKKPGAFREDTMEGSDIKRKQPQDPLPNQGNTGELQTTPSTASKVKSSDKTKPTTRPNRRKFDHIGNIKAISNEHKTTTTRIGADLMEGTNIRRKQPPAKEKINKTVNSATGKRQHKPLAGKSQVKEPSSVEFPNLIRAKTKTTKATGDLYDWHDDFRRKKPRKTKGYIGETEKNLGVKRKTLKSKVKKNQDIEVEKDETHRTKH